MALDRAASHVHVSRDLDVMAAAAHYYDWIFDEIRPWLGSRVLECGAGTGTLTRRLLPLTLARLVVSDVDATFLSHLATLCQNRADVIVLDVEHPSGADVDRLRQSGIDTIVLVNVLEHVSDDAASVSVLARALPPGGRIVVFAPACPFLYSPLDRLYGHHRRYDRTRMRRVAAAAGLRVAALHYVNVGGMVAWLILHTWLRQTALVAGSVRVFDWIAPIARRIESRVRPPVGLSLLAVFAKP
jgi:SAM-dependent methyltransferase